jgi:amphi-Trp domain-containing protein
MAERTSFDTEISRSETADFLRTVADELDSKSQVVTVEVGNKRVKLSPPETVDAAVEVTERSRVLRKDVEELDLNFRWNPVTNTAETDSRANGSTEMESEPDRQAETEARVER